MPMKETDEERIKRIVDMMGREYTPELQKSLNDDSEGSEEMEDKLGVEKHKSWVPGIMGNSYNAKIGGDDGVKDMSNEDSPDRPRLFGKNGINIHLHLGARK